MAALYHGSAAASSPPPDFARELVPHGAPPVSFADENRSACKENAAIYATKELQKDPANDRDKVGQDPKEAADKM